MSVTAVYIKKTSKIELTIDCSFSKEITVIENHIAKQLCKIIKRTLSLEFVLLSEDDIIQMTIYKDNNDILSRYTMHMPDTNASNMYAPLFSKETISECVQNLYLKYVQDNIDVKIEMLGL